MFIPQVVLAKNYCPSTTPLDFVFVREPQAEEKNTALWTVK